METNVKVWQQDQDERAQNALTSKVGVRLERREKPDRAFLPALKRLLRVG